MQKYCNNVQDTYGNAISGVTVTVRANPGGALSTIYSDDGVTPKSNPFTNDSDGEFFFYATNGRYDIEFTGPITDSKTDVILFDPALFAGGGITDGNATGDITVWDGADWTPTTQVQWNTTSERFEFEDDGFQIGRTAVTGNYPGFMNTAGDTYMYFTDTDGGVVVVEENTLRLAAGNVIEIWGSGSGRARFACDSSGYMHFTQDSGVPGIKSDFPIAFQYGLSAPTAVANHAQIYGIGASGFGASLLFQSADGVSFPLVNNREVLYRFNQTNTASEPGATFLRTDTDDISTTTEVYFDADDFSGQNADWFFGMLALGDIILVHQDSNASRWGHFRVDAITDNTTWWTVDVTVLDFGSTSEFVHADPINISVMRQSLVAGAASSAPAVILADINTATPPTTETPAGTYEIWDADETDLLAQLGYTGDNILKITNRMHGGEVWLRAEDSAGTLRTFLAGDPDAETTVRGDTDVVIEVAAGDNAILCTGGGAIQLYYNNIIRFRTLGGGNVGIRSDTSTDTEQRLYEVQHQDGTRRGFWGHAGGATIYFRNEIHGGPVQVDSEDSGSTVRTILNGDPDSTTILRADTDLRLEVAAGELAIFAAANGAVTLYYDEQGNFRTSDEAGNDVGMGAEVRHNDDTFYPVGMNVVPNSNSLDSGDVTLSQARVGKMLTYNTGTARDLNFDDDSALKVGSMFALKVGPSAGTLTGDGGTGVVIRWWNGSGWTDTAAAGNITIGVGDYTIWKETDTLFHISGPNLS